MAQDFAKPSSSKKKTATPRAGSAAKSAPTKSTPKKRKTNTRKAATQPKKPPFWAWLAVGAALIGFGMFLNQLSDKKSATDNNKTIAEQATPAEPVDKDDETSQVRFDFYQILKEKEVEVDTTVIESENKPSNLISWLQAASFRQAEDANALRAKLILLNLDASVESSVNQKQETWYRVMVGPFESRSKLAKARSILASHSIKSIVIKRKPTP